ncbi:TPA: HTH domain-containing protein [Bacillus cereus]
MNTLISNLITDKSVKRKIRILEILNAEQQFITSIRLAKQLNCSDRTISSEMSELKTVLPEN